MSVREYKLPTRSSTFIYLALKRSILTVGSFKVGPVAVGGLTDGWAVCVCVFARRVRQLDHDSGTDFTLSLSRKSERERDLANHKARTGRVVDQNTQPHMPQHTRAAFVYRTHGERRKGGRDGVIFITWRPLPWVEDWQKKQRSLFPAESEPHPSPWQLRHLV